MQNILQLFSSHVDDKDWAVWISKWHGVVRPCRPPFWRDVARFTDCSHPTYRILTAAVHSPVCHILLTFRRYFFWVFPAIGKYYWRCGL